MIARFPIELHATQVAEFRDNGYLVTPEVFTPQELRALTRAVDDEVARRTVDDVRVLAAKSTYEQSFIQCMRLWETAPEVAPFSMHAGLAGIAAQLLEVDSLVLWQDQALYKEAGGRETTPHQDQTFWPIGSEPLVSAWIALDDVSQDNGAMSYVPGSHKVGGLKVVDITHTSEPYDILQDPALGGSTPRTVEVSAGSVVWHHGFTVHQAAANNTPRTRRVFTTVYLSAQARRAKAWPAYPLDRAGVGVGEVIAGEGLPQVWPPLSEMPKVPAAVSQATGPQYSVPQTPS